MFAITTQETPSQKLLRIQKNLIASDGIIASLEEKQEVLQRRIARARDERKWLEMQLQQQQREMW